MALERTSQHDRVLVDMDNVMADFDGAIFENLKLHDSTVEERPRNNFLFRGDYPEYRAVLGTILHAQGYYESLGIVDGTLEGWELLLRAGYDPTVCSTPLVTSEYCIPEKKSWLAKKLVPHFGKRVVEGALFPVNKGEVDGLALVDDAPSIQGADTATWEQVVYDRSYNTNVAARYRISRLDDPRLPEYLERIRHSVS